MLKKYVIERAIPGIGSQPAKALCGVAGQSNQVLESMGDQIQWIESFVTPDGTYCIYLAANEDLIREHAKRGGFPVNRIAEVRSMLDPTRAMA